MVSEGAGWKKNRAVEEMLRNDIMSLWNKGDRSFVADPNMIEFLEDSKQYPGALIYYIEGIAATGMIALGYMPMDADILSFNIKSYRCFHKFEQYCGDLYSEWLRVNKPEVIMQRIEDSKARIKMLQEERNKENRRTKIKFTLILLLCIAMVLTGFIWRIVLCANYSKGYITRFLLDDGIVYSGWLMLFGVVATLLTLLIGIPVLNGAQIIVKK